MSEEKMQEHNEEIVSPELLQVMQAKELAEAAMDKDGLLTLSTGVVIQPLEISKQTVADLVARTPAPQPPQYDPGNKGRLQPNYDAPSYKSAVTSHETQVSKPIFDYILLRGLEVVSVPDHLEPMDSDDWLEEMLYVLGLSEVSDIERHLIWFREIAAPSQEDTMLLMYIISRDAFVGEKGVNDALASLKSDESGS